MYVLKFLEITKSFLLVFFLTRPCDKPFIDIGCSVVHQRLATNEIVVTIDVLTCKRITIMVASFVST